MTISSRFIRRAVLAFLLLVPIGVAFAEPSQVADSPPSGVIPIAVSIVAALLSAAAFVLTIVAPRTKTPVDDYWRDKVKELLELARRMSGMDPAHAKALMAKWAIEADPEIARLPSGPSRIGMDDHWRDLDSRIGAPSIAGTMADAESAHPADQSSGHSRIGSVPLIALLIGGLATQPACATVKAVPPAAGNAIVECAEADIVPILLLVARWAIAAARAGHVDWPAVETDALAHGEVIGGCAVDRFVDAIEPRQSATILPFNGAGSMTRERLRAQWGGVQWHRTEAR